MKGITRKALFSFVSLVLAVTLLVGSAGLRSASSQSTAVDSPPPLAEEVYENIDVLKGVPYSLVIPTMYLFSESLGVECDYCHAPSRMRHLDVKPAKQTAKEMLRMVNAINRNTFGGNPKVTCQMCHRGRVKPVDLQILAGELLETPSAESNRGGDIDSDLEFTVDQVLDTYTAALGGAAALEKISTRVERGVVTERRTDRPETVAVEIYSKFPDKRSTRGFSVAHIGNLEPAFGIYDGEEGWLRESDGPVRVMYRSRLDAAKLEDTLTLSRGVERIVSQLVFEGTEKVGDRETYVLSGRTQILPLVKLHFDQASGLLTRLAYFTATLVGSYPTVVEYSDYREVDGVKVPFRWNVALIRNRRLTYQIQEVEQNIPIDDSVFAQPTPSPEF